MGLCIITCFMFLCLLNPHHSTTLLAHPSNPPSTCFHHFPMCMRSKMHGHPHLIILLTDIPITTIFSLYTTCPFFKCPWDPFLPPILIFSSFPPFSHVHEAICMATHHTRLPHYSFLTHAKEPCMHGRFHFLHTPQTRKKGQGEWTQTIKGVGAENPHIFLHFLFLEIYFSGKKMATKVPIGVGLSLVSLPCASNVRSLVLKSAFFGHGA